MDVAPSLGTRHSFKTGFGRAVYGTLFEGSQASERSVVLLGALAAPQRYLRHTAKQLMDEGYGVLTFDYRGVGESRLSGDPRTNLDDWAVDVRSALEEGRRVFGAKTLLAVGHSLGGMLLGHSGAGDLVDGALLVAASHGQPRFYRGPSRLRIETAYRVLPALARVFGGLPRWAGLTTHVPRDVIVQWIRWGRGRRFRAWNGESSERRFTSLRGPLIGVAVKDDSYAPCEAVDELLAKFSGAGVRRVIVGPDAKESIGHFGMFRPGAPLWLRRRFLTWLRELESA